MRTFIAVKVSDEIKDYLSRLQRRLRESQADVKWVEPKNIHLTLKFLGEQDEGSLSRISDCLQKISSDSHQYALRLGSIGAFPSITSPRVIWVGLTSGEKETLMIAEKIETALAAIGIPAEDRPFSGHITIGRTRSSRNIADLKTALSELSKKPAEQNYGCLVEAITLYKSTLTPRGPLYEILQEFPLS